MGNFNRDRGSRSGRDGGFRPRFNERSTRGPAEMHQVVCDNCRKDCEVPFRPTSGKPVFCSNCFEGNNRGREQFQSRPQYAEQFEQLNHKLDQILTMLAPKD